MKPSKYQLAIYDTFENTDKNICVIASAGSGKTSTLIELLKKVPKNKSTIFLSFNKAIAEENRKKVPQNIDVSTIHSVGMKTLYKHYSCKLKVNDMKNFILAKKNIDLKGIKKDKQNSYIMSVCNLLNKLKFNLLTNESELLNLVDTECIGISGNEIKDTLILRDKVEEYNESYHDEFMIDFTDMIYLPVKYGISVSQYDNVFVDECQDISILQKRFIDKLIKPRGRFIAVGDEKQSIYKFMGADSNSFSEFMKHKNTVTLPLSVSYRCSRAVVNEANSVIEGTEYHEGNPEGEVVVDGSLEDIQEKDLVLCRNNSPLVELYLYFLKNKKKSIIYGKDFGKSLQKMLDKVITLSPDEAISNLEYNLNLISKELSDKGVTRPEFHPKYVSYSEKIVIIKILLQRYKTVKELYDHIDDIYSDDTREGIILSTIHAQKGRQATNVFLYKRSLIPSKFCITPEDFLQEKHLMYVAITRAINKFTYIKE